MSYIVHKASDNEFVPVPGAPGLERALLVGPQTASTHMEYSICRLAPGASTPPLRHAFEESWFVLSGSGSAFVADQSLDIVEDSFGFTPLGLPEKMTAGSEGLTWLRMRAPQPRIADPRGGDLAAVDWTPRTDTQRIDEKNPSLRWSGQFDDADMGVPGPLVMPGVGYYGPSIKNVWVRMLIDAQLGAQQHTMFIVEAAPSPDKDKFAAEHYHAFEEAYFLLSGSWRGVIDGEPVHMSAGDLAWTSVNATHGFVTDGDEPVRWLEVQAPQPPRSHAFFFPDDWA